MVAQQNLPEYDLAVVILEAQSNVLEALLPFVPKILELLSRPISGVHRVTA